MKYMPGFTAALALLGMGLSWASAGVYVEMNFENQSGAVGTIIETIFVVPGYGVNAAGDDSILRANRGYPTGISDKPPKRPQVAAGTMGFPAGNKFARLESHSWGTPGSLHFDHANGFNAPFAGSDKGLQTFSVDLSISSAAIVAKSNVSDPHGPRISLATAWQGGNGPDNGLQTLWTLQVRNSGTEADPVARIDLTGDGSTWSTLAPAISPNEVYHVDIVMDINRGTIQGYIDGIMVLPATAMNAKAHGFIDFAISAGVSGDDTYLGVDNLVLQSGNAVIESTPLAMSATLAHELHARLR